MQRGKHAFTLIELLVVIAIIAILAAILFPVFAQAREKARGITCVSNQKQIALGMLMYMQDYDETFPQNQYYWPGSPNNIRTTWADMIQPYIKNGDKHVDNNGTLLSGGLGGVWSCPSGPKQDFNYGVPINLCQDGSVPWNWTQVPKTYGLAAIDNPADRVFLIEKGANTNSVSFDTYDDSYWNWVDNTGPVVHADGTNADGYLHLDTEQHPTNGQQTHDCDYSINPDPTAPWVAPWDGCSLSPRYRHSGTTNVAFTDGHVKSQAKNRLNYFRNIYLTGISPALPN
jgi:prepilin-type N-terminal cleavage/methylation domain-containing protein/prepilin-type processing-associated H-X9-DG protein